MARSYRWMTTSELATMRALYDDGHSLREIGRRLNRHHAVVREALTRDGTHEPHWRHLTEAKKRKLGDMFRRGYSYARMAAAVGCDPKTAKTYGMQYAGDSSD